LRLWRTAKNRSGSSVEPTVTILERGPHHGPCRIESATFGDRPTTAVPTPSIPKLRSIAPRYV
jgi:hypothetical protein